MFIASAPDLEKNILSHPSVLRKETKEGKHLIFAKRGRKKMFRTGLRKS